MILNAKSWLILLKAKFGKDKNQTNNSFKTFFKRVQNEELMFFRYFSPKKLVVENVRDHIDSCFIFLDQSNRFKSFIQKYRFFSQKNCGIILDHGPISIKTPEGRFWNIPVMFGNIWSTSILLILLLTKISRNISTTDTFEGVEFFGMSSYEKYFFGIWKYGTSAFKRTINHVSTTSSYVSTLWDICARKSSKSGI